MVTAALLSMIKLSSLLWKDGESSRIRARTMLTDHFSMIVIATFALNVGHPGLVFDPRKSVSKSPASEAVEERIHETKLKSAET